MADPIRIPVELDLGAVEALTQDLPALAREAGQKAGEALGEGLGDGTKAADAALRALERSITKSTKTAVDGADKIQAELAEEIKAIHKAAEGFQDVADVQAKVKEAVTSATKAAERRMASLETSTQKTSRSLMRLGEVGEKVGRLPGVGRMGSLVGGLAASFGALLSPVGLAVAGVAALGAAFLGTAAAGAALVYGIGSLIHGYEDLVDAVRPMKEIGMGVPQEEIDSLGRAKAGLDSVGIVIKRLALDYASKFAPAVEEGTLVLVALGLAAVDAFNTLVEGQDPVKATFREMAKGISPVLRGVQLLINAHLAVDDLLGGRLPETVRKYAETTSQAIDRIFDLPYEVASSGWEKIKGAMGGYVDKARDLIAAQKKVNDELWKGSKAIQFVDFDMSKEIQAAEQATASLADRWVKFAADRGSEQDKILASYGQEINMIQGLIDKGADRAQGQALINMLTDEMNAKLAQTDPLYLSQEQRLEAIRAKNQEIRDIQQASIGALMDGLGAFSSLAQTTYQSRMNAYQELVDQHSNLDRALTASEKAQEDRLRSAAKRAWIWQQSLAVTQALAQGAVAAVTAIAQLGPVAGAIAVAGIVASTVAGAVATIKSQKPEFARGGIVDPSYGDSMGRVQATVEVREAVLNQRATAALGAQAINQLNATGSMGGGQVMAAVMFRDQVLDTMMFRATRGPGQFADLIRQITTPGRASMVMA